MSCLSGSLKIIAAWSFCKAPGKQIWDTEATERQWSFEDTHPVSALPCPAPGLRDVPSKNSLWLCATSQTWFWDFAGTAVRFPLSNTMLLFRGLPGASLRPQLATRPVPRNPVNTVAQCLNVWGRAVHSSWEGGEGGLFFSVSLKALLPLPLHTPFHFLLFGTLCITWQLVKQSHGYIESLLNTCSYDGEYA